MYTDKSVSHEKIESRKPQTIRSPLKTFLTTQAIIGIVLVTAFKGETRKQIKARAKRKSELDSNFSGNFFKLEAAHKYHDNSQIPNPGYELNIPENGVIVTTAQHHHNLIGGPYNPDGTENPGGVDHRNYKNYYAENHFTPKIIGALGQMFGGIKNLFYVPPKWEVSYADDSNYGRAITGNGPFQKNLGAVYRPPTEDERLQGYDGFIVPVTHVTRAARGKKINKIKEIPVRSEYGYEYYQQELGEVLNLPPEDILFSKKNFDDKGFKPKW